MKLSAYRENPIISHTTLALSSFQLSAYRENCILRILASNPSLSTLCVQRKQQREPCGDVRHSFNSLRTEKTCYLNLHWETAFFQLSTHGENCAGFAACGRPHLSTLHAWRKLLYPLVIIRIVLSTLHAWRKP